MKRQYVASERAHFMCPNMHFGMIVEIDKNYNKDQVEATFWRMAEAHPFLKSLIAYEEGTDNIYYHVTDYSQINIVVRNNESSLWSDYKKISEKDWNVFENGMLRVYIYPKQQGMTLLFVAHHLLVDGRGLLELAEEFANDYVGEKTPVYAEEVLMESIDDLPPKSKLAGISKMLVKRMNKLWAKENHTVNYEQYAQFVETYSKNHPVDFETYEVEKESVTQMAQVCKEHGFSMNDLLMAHMYVKTGTEKIIIAADIRNKFAKYQRGSLGNYSTAMGIAYKAKSSDVITVAKEVRAVVQKHLQNNRTLMLVLACYFEMSPTLLDAAAISALKGFESKAAGFVGAGMFGFGEPKSHSITNLGKVENEHIKSLTFIPPASPAAKFTLGVVTLNGTMKACSSSNHV